MLGEINSDEQSTQNTGGKDKQTESVIKKGELIKK